MEYAVKTLQQAIQHFADFANCRKYMEFMRWPDGVIKCPSCSATKLTWLAKERVYLCYGDHKRKKFSLKVGTIFEDSPIGLDKWLSAMWLLSSAKNGISSYELHRSLGVTQKTAWFMLHRIRLAMKNKSLLKIGTGGEPIEVDETWVGGKHKNLHAKKRERIKDGWEKDNKTIVMGMLDRDTRQVRAKVIPDVSRLTLQGEILKKVSKAAPVYTDSAQGYNRMAIKGFVHETVNHMEEYVRGEVHTNGIENFWSLLKRTLGGTYVAVEPFHMDAYLDEQMFRFNNRATKDNPLTDADRFTLAVSQIVGRRLTYAELTGKVGETAF
ncbi:MAG: IS1595 family transposase [Formivibrio sp.]|nr:IS1595 family transposase [Formivibrio sp.]